MLCVHSQDTGIYFDQWQLVAIYDVCDYFCVIIDWSSIGRC